MTRPGSSQVRLWSAALLVVLLLAFGLRTYQLEAQSLWSDEGLSLYRAGQLPAELLRGVITVDGVATRDTNPPFYFLLLHAWQSAGGVGQVAGAGVFYLRYLSVLAGLLAVPLLYLLGRRAFGWGVGLAAALLLAISPFHVWMSQELRNYSLLVLLNLFSVYGLYRFMLARPDGEPGARRGRWLALWAAAGLLGVYTHYFGFFVLAYGGLSLLLLDVSQTDATGLLVLHLTDMATTLVCYGLWLLIWGRRLGPVRLRHAGNGQAGGAGE